MQLVRGDDEFVVPAADGLGVGGLNGMRTGFENDEFVDSGLSGSDVVREGDEYVHVEGLGVYGDREIEEEDVVEIDEREEVEIGFGQVAGN